MPNGYDPDASFAEVTAQRGLGPTSLDYVGRTTNVSPSETKQVWSLRGGWAANQPPPTTDDLIGSAVEARQQISFQRQNLINQLGGANRRRAQQITAQLHGLDRDEHFNEWQAAQRRIQAHSAALDADREIKRERDTQIDEQGADAMMRMHALDRSLRNGYIDKEQFDDAMLDLGRTHFDALRHHPEASKHWASYLDHDDKMSQYEQRLNLREAAKLTAKYGVPLHLDDNSGEVDLESMRNAVIGTPRGQAEALGQLNNEIHRRYGLPLSAVFENAVGGIADNPKDPNSFKQTDPNDKKNPQTHVQMTMVSPSGGQHNILMDKGRFDMIKNEFAPAYQAIVSAGQPRVTPTADPRTELAQRALNDPNASEAHKAAAKKILGIE